MGSLELVKAGTEVLKPGEATLTELAARVNREHDEVVAAVESALEHAIRAGGALMAAREVVPTGAWMTWVASNLSLSHTTVCTYVRFARYEEHLRNQGVGGIEQAYKVLAGLPYANSTGTGYEDALREDANQLHQDGLSQREIAEVLGIGQTTVWRWVDPKREERARESSRRYQARQRAARQALARQERTEAIKRAVRRAGAATQEAWVMAERMQDVLAQAQRETEDREARQALSEAGVHYRKMRDEIVRALGVS